MLRPDENPPILPRNVHSPQELVGPLWVAHTRSRNEKTFAWDLTKAGVDYFLPLIERTTISGGRKRRVLKPLFGSYVFFAGDHEARYQALATNRLCTVLPVPEPQTLRSELEQIHRALAGEAELDPCPGLGVGSWARVRVGAMAGTEGRVIEWKGGTRLVLQVSMLGQGAAVEIDPDLLEPMGEDPSPAEVVRGGLGV